MGQGPHAFRIFCRIVGAPSAEQSVWRLFDLNIILYTDVNIRILEGEKILVCGENGCGKTTLIRMMTGEIQPDSGTVWLAEKVKTAQLRQFEIWAVNQTVEDSFAQEYSEKRADEYARLWDLFDRAGGYTYLKRKEEFLHIFGFESILNRSICTLSGGEQQYLRLAAAIFSDASLLILDEPFTFLDKGKTVWLLNFLKEIKKTVVVVSHDFALAREFAAVVIRIKDWKVKKYKMGYDAFLKESLSESARNSQHNTTLDNYIESREKSIEKRREWMKKAENKHQHAVIIRRLERDIERAQKSKNEQKQLKTFDVSAMTKKEATPSHDLLISLKNISLTYDKACILDAISLDIHAGQHYLILGDNGAGKTTLLNLIMKNIAPSQGSVTYARKIVFSSLNQFGFDFHAQDTCLDVLDRISCNTKEQWADEYSKYFEDDFWDKRLSVVSGGELKKFLIFVCLLRDFDVLVLDEPTTFVDAQVKGSIIQMLNSCSRCIITVTHDPDILESVTGKKLILRGGKLCEPPQ